MKTSFLYSSSLISGIVLIHKEDAVCLKLLAVKRTFFIDFELFKLELQVKKSNYTLSHINY